ncbi:hypothetical protein BCR33DRAFT_813129 [Rhizoclosmatium globosum]|uniref:Uncharacterized protein n=1 Tax=Rhizoclosmatium globosum TaxID=329046 RepID=A0A1Y2AKC3_9FUNG|nr:hypothetical protein BCR33DRAFT_813129 [Rhizoclosmatium globosum]|eukprot:ORY22405.1 hypothetical protein BCR33DRAFT_813129 [Rhizoclosmatium globosum]
MSVNFNGGTFERFLGPGQDCYLADLVVADPTPATVTVPSNDYNKDNTLVNQMTFVDTSPTCGGSDLVPRLSLAYGHNATGLKFDASFNQDATPYDVLYLRAGFDVSKHTGKRRDLNTECAIEWIPTNRLKSTEYVLEYKNPVCGLSAPKLIDDSAENLVLLDSASVYENRMISLTGGDFQTVLSQAYGVSAETIKSHFICDVKFNITVSSNPDSPNAENSCVYNYIAVDRKLLSRVYSLVDYAIGNQAILPGMNLQDGCINEFMPGSGTFTNTSVECGDGYPENRFERYFGGNINVNVNTLDEANVYLNFTVSNGGRRAPGDISFHYFDKSFSPTTTIASTAISTTLSTSTMVSSSAVVSTALDSSTISVNAATAVASLSASTVIPSVSTTSPIASVKGSAATTISTSVASNAASTTVVASTTVPTGYVAPTGYGGSTAYGVPAAANNIYKSASAGIAGMVTAFIVSLLFAF